MPSFFQFFSNLLHKKERTGGQQTKGITEKKAAHFPFDFDRWYPYLKPYTTPSIILQITPSIAQAMVSFYRTRYLGRHELTDTQIHVLHQLEKTLSKQLKKTSCTTGYFVRMSDRSPKDGNILSQKEPPSITDIKESLKDKTPNDQLIYLMDLQMQLLRCTTAEQMLHLLLSSERVYSDLLLALACHAENPHDEWSTSIVVRNWLPWLKQEYEFRVFIRGKNIQAISQYNTHCYYPELIAQNQSTKQPSLIDQIQTYLAPLQEKIPFDNYIIDLAVSPEQIQIIELNPFEHSTGSCLFSWEADAELLSEAHKTLSPELRIQTEINPKALEYVEVILDDIKNRLDDNEQSYKNWLDHYKSSPSTNNNLTF